MKLKSNVSVALLKGEYDGTFIDLAVDADGNMIAVMKGDYEGALKTWKVDTAGRGEMFIADPTDVWGNIRTMGNAELAVRTHAPPLVFDRRGDVIRWTNFESSTPNYATDGTGLHVRSTDIATNGDFAMKMTCAAGETSEVSQFTNDFHIGRIGHTVVFSSSDTAWRIRSTIMYFDGSNYHYGYLVYDASTSELYHRDGAGMTSLGFPAYRTKKDNFSTFKLVIDIDQKKYVRAICFGTEYDLSDVALTSQACANTAGLHSATLVTGIGAVAADVYVDNIVLTENEPA